MTDKRLKEIKDLLDLYDKAQASDFCLVVACREFITALEEAKAEIKRLKIIVDASGNNLKEAWMGYQLIREILEITQVGAVKNGEYLCPPFFTKEAECLGQAISKLFDRAEKAETEIIRLKGMVNAAVDQREEIRVLWNEELIKRGKAEDEMKQLKLKAEMVQT